MKIRFAIPLTLALCMSTPVLTQHPQEHGGQEHGGGRADGNRGHIPQQGARSSAGRYPSRSGTTGRWPRQQPPARE
jgi:hypothetical protein